jgi:histone acetyltransferase HTATIP
LSRKENKRGTPEKPLSDLGLLGYSSYWKDRVVEQIDIQLGKSRNPHESVNIDSICSSTGMTVNDVLATLEYLRLLKRCPNTGLLEMDLESPNFVDYRAKLKTKRSGLRANPEWVLWSPYTCLR